MDIIINKKYKIIRELGEGAFGKIYVGKNINTRECVAVKLQTDEGAILLRNEAQIYNLLKDLQGIPKLRSYGKEQDVNYMVISLLGKSIEKTVGVYQVINIGIKLIEIIKNVHNRGVIHRDIKPENILYSIDSYETIYLIDFGLSLCYCDSEGCHNKQKNNREIVGSINFISTNIHEGITASRRDDLISICYVIIYLLYGDLPWNINKLKETSITNLYNTIYDIKKCIDINNFYKNIPENIILCYEYCNGLGYDDEPDYNYLCRLLKSIRINNLKMNQ